MTEKHDTEPLNETSDTQEQPDNGLTQDDIKNEQSDDKAKPASKKKKDKKKTEQEEKLEKMKADLEACQDQFLRMRAEYDNFRKRTRAEKAAIYNDAVSDVIAAILPVSDNMERALNQETGSSDDIKKGLQLISKQFSAAFDQLNIKQIGDKGEVFDPNLHNAVSHIEDDALDENVITEVLQKGYMIGDRVIRHAMVQVAN